MGSIVLEGVPRIGFYPHQSTGGPEDHLFPSCVRSCLEHLGDDIREAWFADSEDWHVLHEFACGVSGIAFGLVWDPRNWRDAVCWQMTRFAPDRAEPLRRTLAAAGYGCEVLCRSVSELATSAEVRVTDDEAEYRERIVSSLARGVPVIALGVLGPPDACIVAGWEEEGDALLGWSAFQDEAETVECGYFRKPEWFAGLDGLVLLGEKGVRPEPRAVVLEALDDAYANLRRLEMRGDLAGDDAFLAWAEALRNEQRFATLDEEGRAAWRGTSDGIAGHLAEARTWGAMFLHWAARYLPEAEGELHEAMMHFEALHDLVWRLWQSGGGPNGLDQDPAHFYRADARAEIARIALRMRERDAAATFAIGRALQRYGRALPALALPDPQYAAAERALRGAIAAPKHAGTEGTWVPSGPRVEASATAEGALRAWLAAEAPQVAEWRLTELPLPSEPTEVARDAALTNVTLSVCKGIPLGVTYGGGPALAVGYHPWSGDIMLLRPGTDERVRVGMRDPLLCGPAYLAEPATA